MQMCGENNVAPPPDQCMPWRGVGRDAQRSISDYFTIVAALAAIASSVP